MIYEEIVRAGIPHSNHCSDLYIPVNEFTQKLVSEYEYKSNVTTFRSQIDEMPWYDIPFAYLPYWEKRRAGND